MAITCLTIDIEKEADLFIVKALNKFICNDKLNFIISQHIKEIYSDSFLKITTYQEYLTLLKEMKTYINHLMIP